MKVFPPSQLSHHHLSIISTTTSLNSWETDSTIEDYLDIPTQPDMSLKETFERVENALKTQGHHLKSLDDALNYQDRAHLITSRPLSSNYFSEREASRLMRRYQMWKDGKRNLFRFVEDLESQMDAQVNRHLHNKQTKSQLWPNPQIGSLLPAGENDIVMDSVNLEKPHEVPELTAISVFQRFSSPPTPSSVFKSSVPILRDPKPPIPKRHPSHRVSVKSTPDGEVVLRGMPDGWVSNLLPHEHRAVAEARKRESSREQPSESNLDLQGLMAYLPDSNSRTSSESAQTKSLRTPHPSRSTSSLRLQALPEEHKPVSNIDMGSLRQASTPRPHLSLMQHPPAQNSYQASNIFFMPRSTSVPANARLPGLQLPNVHRASNGILCGGSFGSQKKSRPPSRNMLKGPPSLAETQIRETREKIISDRNIKLFQANECQKILYGLAVEEARTENSDIDWESADKAHSRAGLQNESVSFGGKLKCLWRSKTRKKMTVLRVEGRS